MRVAILIEIGMLSAKVLSFKKGSNDAKLRIELDLLKEWISNVTLWVAAIE